MNRKKQLVIAFALGGIVVGSAGLALQARAAGVPTLPGLTYTGYLENADGAPLTKTVSIAVEVFDAATKGKRVCDASLDSVKPVSGRFQIELPEACAAAVHASPDLWIDVKVDGSSLGRTKLGAVPYALEAERASVATGELEERLSELEARIGPRSALRASLKDKENLKLTSGAPAVVVPFETVEFDLGAELDLAQHAFVPNVAGYYYVACTLTFEGPINGAQYFRAQIYVDGEQREIAGYETTPSTSSRTASGVFRLEAGKPVTCLADSFAPNVFVRWESGVTHFEAVRLSMNDAP